MGSEMCIRDRNISSHYSISSALHLFIIIFSFSQLNFSYFSLYFLFSYLEFPYDHIGVSIYSISQLYLNISNFAHKSLAMYIENSISTETAPDNILSSSKISPTNGCVPAVTSEFPKKVHSALDYSVLSESGLTIIRGIAKCHLVPILAKPIQIFIHSIIIPVVF